MLRTRCVLVLVHSVRDSFCVLVRVCTGGSHMARGVCDIL